MSETDPFAVLGLEPRRDLTDDDVRSAWRRIAAAAHPDRDDGGSPDRYAAAAAAYATLRTPDGRGEALADLAEPWSRAVPRPRRLAGRLRAGRFRAVPAVPWRVPARVVIAAAVCALAFWAAGWSPGTLALFAGAATWLALGLRGFRR